MATTHGTREFLLCIAFLIQQVHSATRPPAIHTQPNQTVYFKAGERVSLPCVADGDPAPDYMWKRNGFAFDPSGNDDRVVQVPGEGTIVFNRTEDKNEGIYQCLATNQFGTSASVRVNLREAKMKDFEPGADRTFNPLVGHSLTLNCLPPLSIPPSFVFWVVKEPHGGFVPVEYEARKIIDSEYRLRITNVKSEDRMGGKPYACMAMNNLVRQSTMGPQFFIDPRGTHEEVRPTTLMFSSPIDHFGLRGDDFTLQCIFAGYPTPDIHWNRTDGAPIPSRAKIQNFGHDLVIPNVQIEDAGKYECLATNSQTVTPVRITINARIESRPYWKKEPQHVTVAPGGTAEFECQAEGEPDPQIFWHINGVHLPDVTDPRITSDRFDHSQPGHIVFSDLTTADSMVIQCNATNRHGYIWSNAILNVLPEISRGEKDGVVG